jgi:sulfatase maturation enzyme AslB (radical SAM superfamily)
LNFRVWESIIASAKEMELDQISFLPADVSSHAFNREVLWNGDRQHEILVDENELGQLSAILDSIVENHNNDFESRFIAESPAKLKKIYDHYAAFYNLNPFPYKKCNAPWVSTVIEADGTVRPCFFHEPLGNIRNGSLEQILNSKESVRFRRDLDMDSNSTCVKCVCYLNLPPGASLR